MSEILCVGELWYNRNLYRVRHYYDLLVKMWELQKYLSLAYYNLLLYTKIIITMLPISRLIPSENVLPFFFSLLFSDISVDISMI